MDLRTQFEGGRKPVASAAHRGNTAVEIRGEPALREFLIGIFRLLFVDAPGCADVDVHVDEPRQQSFTGAIYHFGMKRFGIGGRGTEDLRDFAITDENGTAFEHRSVAHEDFHVLNDGRTAAPQRARDNLRSFDDLTRMSLIQAQQNERCEDGEQPEFGACSDLLLFLPTKELGAEYESNRQSDDESNYRNNIAEKAFAAEHQALQPLK